MPDIITRSNLKSFLQIDHDDDDDFFDLIIPLISAEINEITHIDFQSTSRTEWFDGGIKNLVVDCVPIASITSVTDYADPTAGIVIPATDYAFDPNLGEVYSLVSTWGSGRRRWEIVYVGGVDGYPADVQLAAYQLATIVHQTRNPSIISDVLGDSEVQFDVEEHSGLARKIRSALSRHAETGF